MLVEDQSASCLEWKQSGALLFATQQRRLILVLIGLTGVGLMISGFLGEDILSHQNIAPSAEKSLSTTTFDKGTSSGKLKTIFVDIEGSVERPGVYEIPADSRIKDALISAGGISAKGNRNYVSKNINMAQRLNDGMKIYIPFADDNQSGSTSNTQSAYEAITSLIDINSAGLEQLDLLPSIGPVTAAKIISSRPYSSIDDLLKKKVVNSTVFQKIKDRIMVE